MSGPLQGFKIIEMAAIGPVPFCGMMLSDMGADVVRIDRRGSPVAHQGNPVNRGRRSIALDLKQPGDIDIALSLISAADALLEGFRPGVMERLGLGPDRCLQHNPRLVYGRMTGWGQTGPLAQAAGHDINYIALTGALHAMSRDGQPPSPPLNLIGDYGGGAMLLASGVLAALLEASRSGQGQVVDAAMTDGSASLMSLFHGLQAEGMWRDEPGTNMLDGGAHFYNCYVCADGKFISIGPIEPQFYASLLQLCDINDADFSAQMNTAQWPTLKNRLSELFKTRTRDQWCDLLEGSDACFAPVLDTKEAAMHPHNMARQTFVSHNGINQAAPAPRFSRTPGAIGNAPAAADEHRDAILKDWIKDTTS
ncbi:carnitine dehydratase [Pseudohongiella acticola]|jgi:alpha-methylacyl-CoA racemase|uniref:Carnitine dehydratase n=1 Tax=Pseudohongiella acticola TaxID=1524254 RepID=A0A1E8CHZ7_9GAMM|nr:CaiB/BaiF CoA-transferase family protein [Pseudohongiella acticola]OFE12076.1 carnitine dehydratase [Pseudohongiella acticola]